MTILSSFCELLQLYKLPLHFNKLSTADMRTLNIYYGFCSSCPPYFVHRCMLLSKLKNSGPKLMCTGPGPTNTRDEVMVTAEYLGCTGAPATLDSDTSHYNNHHAHYITSSVSPYPRPSSAAVSWSCGVVSTCHVSWVSGQWLVSTIGRNNTDPESIKRDTTNTHWPLDITIIHSLAILRQIG